MLLDILTELFLVRLLELIDYVVVLSVVIELLLELLDPLLKLLLRVHDLQLHLGYLVLVLLLDLPLSVLHLSLVLLKLLLCFFPLSGVPLFDIADHRLNIGLLPGFFQCVLLPGHHRVGFSKYGFYLFLIGPGE